MTSWIYVDLAVFFVVVVLAGIIIPQILLIAFRKNLFDEVDPRKIHKGAVPRLGGIAFFPAILFSVLLMFGLGRQCGLQVLQDVSPQTLTSLCLITCAVIVLYLVGMADDLIGLKYRAKFVAQFVAAALVIAGGIFIDDLHGFILTQPLPTAVAVILTAVLTVFITNAINLIDGIDGLASGLSGIACAFYGVMLFRSGLHVFGMLAFATLGALVPFFYYNVFGNAKKHSKIFMGDTGALTIGLILSVLSIRLCRTEDVPGQANMAVAAFAPLLIPCLDVVRVYLHRLKSRRNPFLPDKTHIHHKLLALGMSQRIAMPAIVAASLALTLLNYWLSIYVNIIILFLLDITLWTGINIALSKSVEKRK